MDEDEAEKDGSYSLSAKADYYARKRVREQGTKPNARDFHSIFEEEYDRLSKALGGN